MAVAEHGSRLVDDRRRVREHTQEDIQVLPAGRPGSRPKVGALKARDTCEPNWPIMYGYSGPATRCFT
jgi:hypothetical protein